MKPFKLAVILLAGLATGCAAYSDGYVGGASASSNILTTASGMTLYTFDKDADSESNCYEACAAKWPPYLSGDGEAPVEAATKTIRRDGSEQWTVNSQPLYTWVGDKNPGDTTGDGVGNVWHTAVRVDVAKAVSAGSSY